MIKSLFRITIIEIFKNCKADVQDNGIYLVIVDLNALLWVIVGLVIEPLSSGSGLGSARKARLELGS